MDLEIKGKEKAISRILFENTSGDLHQGLYRTFLKGMKPLPIFC